VADPENSVFYDYFHSGDCTLKSDKGSNVEGIGRPRVEPSFVPQVIDRMIRVPDAATYATIHFLEKLLNRKPGGSTGTNVYAAFRIMAELNAQGHTGSVVSMLCDPGDRYLDTYYDAGWLEEKGFDLKHCLEELEQFYDSGKMS
jgi:cysteine synthase A